MEGRSRRLPDRVSGRRNATAASREVSGEGRGPAPPRRRRHGANSAPCGVEERGELRPRRATVGRGPQALGPSSAGQLPGPRGLPAVFDSREQTRDCPSCSRQLQMKTDPL